MRVRYNLASTNTYVVWCGSGSRTSGPYIYYQDSDASDYGCIVLGFRIIKLIKK